MMNPKNISIDKYTYNLPDDKIAKHPLEQRDNSKLLIYKDTAIIEDNFYNISNYLSDKNMLVFNNTKVIQARLFFRKKTGAKIEIFCLEPHNPAEYTMALEQNSKCSWKCIVGNSKKWKEGDLELEFDFNGNKKLLKAKKVENDIIEFTWDDLEITFSQILETLGNIPIPPYLQRESEESDLERYQTVYSKYEGSVAAPTAGLHFTDTTFEKLKQKNIKTNEITLHVGAGTFKPVKTENIGDHDMHTEHIFIYKSVLRDIVESKKEIVAVGTTSVRTLESMYWMGVKLLQNKSDFNYINQWEVYEAETSYTKEESLGKLLNYMETNELDVIAGATQIIIAPGYSFKLVDVIVTNFHQPKSTLLLLISAFIGENWQTIYQYALDNNFRFLSYGDSSILFRE